jgi:hypothetical protein
MLEEVRLLPCEFVVGHGPDEEDFCSLTYIVSVWLFYSFADVCSD